jgi:HK97 family phage portal protein
MLSFLMPRRRADDSYNRDPISNFWYGPVGRAVSSGVTVTQETALTYSACWAATKLLCGTAGRLPVNKYLRGDDGSKSIDGNDVRNRLVFRKPNPHMTPMMWKSQGVAQQVNAGNAFSEIQRDRKGGPFAFWPIHRSRVSGLIDPDTNDLYYQVKNNDGTHADIPAADILHFPSMMSDDGIWGKGVVEHAKETIGTGLAAVISSGSMFGSGGIPRVVVESPKKWSEDSRKNFRKEWKEIYGGPNGDKVGVMDEGSKLHPLNLNYRDMQFQELQQHIVEEVARWYGVPPHKIQHLLRSTNNNIEHQGLEFITDSLVPWLVLIEEELDRKLLTEDELNETNKDGEPVHYFAFKVLEYLRGDTAARADYWTKLVNAGIANRRQARIAEDMNPVSGDETFLVQGGMVALDEEGKPTAFGGDGTTPTAPDEMDGDAMPTDAESAAVAGDVQATALNGAQIVALVDIATRLAAEQLPPEGTRAMLQAAFPLMPQKLIDTMVEELDKFEPKQPEQPQGGSPAPAKDGEQSDDEDEESEDGATATARDVVRIVLQDTLSRMIRKETTAARRAANKPGEFLKWMDEFYAKHEEHLAESLGFAEQASAKLNLIFSAKCSAQRLCEQSKAALLKASETTADKFAEAIEQLAAEWETSRAAEIVREYFERQEQ